MIHLGTSGFSFDDWKGRVYPENIKKGEMLEYYEKELGFDLLEVNFTYYTLPSRKTLEGMSKKTSSGFMFVVKAFKGMTHEIRNSRKEIIDNREIFEHFNYSLKPLMDEGKLTAVLAQFPYSFGPVKEHLDYLETFRDRMKDVPVVVEFRNKAWTGDTTITFLRGNNLGYCVVDEPKLPGLMLFNPEVTSDIAYFRFHGRNRNWFNVPSSVRYDYLYREEELMELAPAVKNLSGKSKLTLVLFNNCHAGSAVKNAIMFSRILSES